jgi:hypothetical protein
VRFFRLAPKQGPQFYDGEFHPYPDLGRLFLERGPIPTVHVEIRTGTRPGDMIFAAFNVVSSRFLDALQECRATGYETFPIELHKRGKLLDLYYGIRLLGRGGPFDKERSNADIRNGGTVHGYSAIHMDETQWDKSDVFAIPGLGISMCVVERVEEELRKAKLLNVRMTLNTECRFGSRNPWRP